MAKSNLPEKIILSIFILAFLFLVVNAIIGRTEMHIVVPGGLFALVAIYVFRQYDRAKKDKRENRQEYMNERRQEILDDIFKKNRETDSKKER